MGLYDVHRRPLIRGDLVLHYDSGYIGFVLDASESDSVTVFMLNKVREIFKGSISRIKDGH